MIAAFFDVDGTLYTAHMWRGLMEYCKAHGRSTNVRMYYASLMPLFYLRRLRLISEESFRRPWVPKLGWMLKGWTEEQGNAALRWVAEEFIRPTGREDILDCLREHKQAGHAVILVSAMLQPSLAVLGEGLGATGVVGTDVEIRNRVYTGNIIPPVCMGIEKDRLTRRFVAAKGLAIDFAASYAYADSISDRALFDMVGHPVAVYPDAQLASLAKSQRWEIRGVTHGNG